MKWFTLLVSILFVTIRLNAQVSITGNVTDSAGNAIPNATISVIATGTKAIIAYSRTNGKGYFEITIPATDNSFIRISCIGYANIEKPVSEQEKKYRFILKPSIYSLPEVVVKNRNILRLKGDTLSYNVKEFTRTQDRTIGDIIRNLPGITVSPSGTISYNGKPINKFYIDGDDLLGDKYGVASNTLPADMVDAIQVLENHQPIKMLENASASDNAALNLKLNNKARLRVFGSGNAGAGIPLLAADARVNLLAFLKKVKMVDVIAFNNTGAEFSSEIVSQNTIAPGQKTPEKIREPLTGFTQSPTPLIPYRYFNDNFDQMVTLNHLVPISKTRNSRINLNWLPENITQNTSNTQEYYLPADTIRQFERQEQNNKKNTLFLGYTFTDNAEKKYVQNELEAEYIKEKGRSVIENENLSFQQQLKHDFFRLKNALTIKKIAKRNIIPEFRVELRYQNFPEQLDVNRGLYAWLLNKNDPYRQTIQDTRQEKYTLLGELAVSRRYKNVLAGLRAEYRADKEQYTSAITLVQLNKQETLADSLFRNNLRWWQQQFSLNPTFEYQYKRIKFSFASPVAARGIRYDNSFFPANTKEFKITFNPFVKLVTEHGRYAKTTLSVRMGNDFTDANDLLGGGLFSNYRNLSQSLQKIQESITTSTSAGFSYRNPIRVTFFNMGVIYARTKMPFINSSSIQSGIIQGKQVAFDNETERILLISGLSKYLVPLKTTIKTGINSSFTRFYQLQNNSINHLYSQSHQLNLTVSSRPAWYFNCEANINYQVSKAVNLDTKKQTGNPVHTWNNSFVTNLNFTENIFLQAEANHIVQSASGKKNSFVLVDGKCNYQIKKTKTDIGIKAINILNTRQFSITDINGTQVSTNSYRLRPFTLLVYASFRF
jgi:hypothetical protein